MCMLISLELSKTNPKHVGGCYNHQKFLKIGNTVQTNNVT